MCDATADNWFVRERERKKRDQNVVKRREGERKGCLYERNREKQEVSN